MENLLKQLLEGQNRIDHRLNNIEKEITSIKSDVAELKSNVTELKSDLAELKTTVNNIEGQQLENSRFIHALRHNSEEVNAQLHNIGHNLNVLTSKAATKEDVALLDAKFDLLNARLFNQEAEFNRHMKAVK